MPTITQSPSVCGSVLNDSDESVFRYIFSRFHKLRAGTPDLDQDLVACNRRRRYITEHQLPTVFQRQLSFDFSFRVTACPVGELRERAAELAFQASDVGAVADALEPFEHQRHLLAELPDLFDWRLREPNWPTQRLRQDLRRLRHRSYVSGKIDLAAVQGSSISERAHAQPANIVHRNH